MLDILKKNSKRYLTLLNRFTIQEFEGKEYKKRIEIDRDQAKDLLYMGRYIHEMHEQVKSKLGIEFPSIEHILELKPFNISGELHDISKFAVSVYAKVTALEFSTSEISLVRDLINWLINLEQISHKDLRNTTYSAVLDTIRDQGITLSKETYGFDAARYSGLRFIMFDRRVEQNNDNRTFFSLIDTKGLIENFMSCSSKTENWGRLPHFRTFTEQPVAKFSPTSLAIIDSYERNGFHYSIARYGFSASYVTTRPVVDFKRMPRNAINDESLVLTNAGFNNLIKFM